MPIARPSRALFALVFLGACGRSSVFYPPTVESGGCALQVTPSSLDFGNILVGASATDQITLFNDGGAYCEVSGVSLDPGTDPDFSLPARQATSVVVPPDAEAHLAVTFDDLSGASPPFLRKGSLSFLTGDPVKPRAAVPLLAFVNPTCTVASQWIYTVEQNGTLARFDPQSLSFSDIGTIDCPAETGDTPYSMAVDQDAVAWVVYSLGDLFRVDTASASCQPTSFVPNQDQIPEFGMSFLFQPETGVDTLYVVGVTETSFQSVLATIAFPSLALSPVGAVPVRAPGELAGTGDGELWDFIPPDAQGALLVQLDPATGNVLQQEALPGITMGGDFAMKFWGGAFWIFIGDSLQRVDRATGAWTTPVPHTGRGIVGAGVSTCAPVQSP